ncbi:MAG: hypothetical protein IJT97_01575 [Bacteroidaceae bacterium]|nr:hypothetical protein [Bacteroidaceae bacterium]
MKTMPEAEEQDIKRVMDLLEDAKKKEETRHEPTPEENCAIRDCIVNHKGFATKFFCEILSPMMNGFVNKIRNIYDVDVALHDVRTIIYTELYDGGNWTRLRSYEGRCSIFTWVSRVASQVLVSQLVKEGIISLSNGRMAMNTSLTLKSMKSREERQLVIDLVDVPQWHDLLTSIYVKDRGVVETMGVLCMTEQVFKKTLSLAKKSLKEQLIAKESYYWRRKDGKVVNLVSLALRDRGIFTEPIDEESLSDMKNVFEDDVQDFRKQVLDIIYPGLPTKMQWYKFVYDHAMRMKWSKENETIWVARYCDNEPPVDLADRLGRKRSWVDNRYSRLNRALVKSMKEWWEKDPPLTPPSMEGNAIRTALPIEGEMSEGPRGSGDVIRKASPHRGGDVRRTEGV